MDEWDGGEYTVRDIQYGRIDRTVIKSVVGKKCPKCGKEILSVGYMGEADSKGVTGFVVHSFKTVQHIMGESQQPDEKCFLTDDNFENLINNKEE